MRILVTVMVLVGGLAPAFAQDVFVLGGPGSAPVPPIVYQPPIVTGSYQVVQPVVAAIPVVPVYAPAYAPVCNYGYYNYDPYTYGQGYYEAPCYSPAVLAPFGREQAYRHGYRFNHPR